MNPDWTEGLRGGVRHETVGLPSTRWPKAVVVAWATSAMFGVVNNKIWPAQNTSANDPLVLC